MSPKVRNSKELTASPPQRADAKRNRDKLLVSADAVFTERGADASMEEIARHAGVGIGTLYRHFSTREALLAAACDDRLVAIADNARAQSARGSSSEAIEKFLTDLVFYAGMYNGLASSLGVVLQNGTPGCHATTEMGKALLERAKKTGEIRRDVQFDDVVCMATAISLAVARNPADGRRVHRLVGMFVEGLRSPSRKKTKS